MDLQTVNFEALFDFEKTYEIEIEKHTPSKGKWIVEGYGSTSDLDAQDHIVSPEAIKMGAECLMQYNTVLFNHDPDRPIGKIEFTEAQDTKLFMKVAISKTEPKLWEQIKDGTLSKFSIRGKITDYDINKNELTGREIVIIKGMELHEVSLVSVPANVHAKSLNWYVEKAFTDEGNMKKDKEQHLSDNKLEDAKEFIMNVMDTLKLFIGLAETKKSITEEEIKVEDKGGLELEKEIKDEKKEEVVEEKPELVIEKSESKDIEKTSLDISALKDVLTQLQELAKQVNSQTEEVKKGMDEVTKTKDEVTKMVTDLNSVIKEIPLRKTQPAELEKVDERKDEKVEDDFTKSEDYQKMKPADKLHKLFTVGAGKIK